MKTRCLFAILILCTSFIFPQNTRKFNLENGETYSQYIPTGGEVEVVVQEPPSGSVEVLKYSLDGKYLMSGTFTEAKVYDVETGYLLKSFTVDVCEDFSPDGKYFVSLSKASEDYGIRLVNIWTGEETVIGYMDPRTSIMDLKISFSPDGKFIAVPMFDQVDIYSVETLEKFTLLKNFKTENFSEWYFRDDIAWSPDSRCIAVVTGYKKDVHGDTLLVYDVFEGNVVGVIGVNQKTLKCPSFANNSKKMVCADNENTVYIFDLASSRNFKYSLPSDLSGKLVDLTVSEDGSEIYILANNVLIILGFSDSKGPFIKHAFEFPGSADSFSLAFNHKDKSQFARGMRNMIATYNKNDGKRISIYEGNNTTSRLNSHQNINDSSIFISEGEFETSALFDEKFGEYNKVKIPDGARSFVNIACFDGGFYYREQNSTKIMRYTFSDGKSKEFIDTENTSITIASFVSSGDGNRLALIDVKNKALYFYDFIGDGYNALFKWSGFPEKFYYDLFGYSCFSSDGNLFFCCGGVNQENDVRLETVDDFLPSFLFDIEKKEAVYAFLNTPWARFSDDGSKLAVYADMHGGETHIYDTNQIRQSTETYPIKRFTWFNSFPFFSHDNKNLAMYALDKQTGKLGIDIYDVDTWKKKKRIDAPYRYNWACFSTDGDKIFIEDVARIIRCYSVKSGQLLASFMQDETGENYFIYTPEGYFTGTPDGINKFVHLVDGMKVFELGQLYDTLYRPDLVQAKLEGKDIGQPVLKELVATGDAPLVRFTKNPMATSRNIKIEFSVQDTGGGVGYVYLSQNGKAMQVSSGEESKTGRRFIYTCDVTLAPGQNTFEVYASNAANKIECRHAATSVNWQGRAEKGSLYVLALGVNVYEKNPDKNLSYCVSDAKAMIESFESSPGGMYKSVNVMTLLDGQVNKENIQTAFDVFAAKVQPDDTFVIHIAGHGTNSNGEYYFLPANFPANKERDLEKWNLLFAKQCVEYGVSKHFLTENLSKIKSLNTLVLLDTCYSGAFIDSTSATNSLAQTTALEHLAHTSGQVILTASSNSQMAGEGWKGHGIFTYAMMQALSGKANFNADSSVSIKEIAQYLNIEIPNIYEKMNAPRQSPWVSPIPGDFALISSTKNPPSPKYTLSLDGEKSRNLWYSMYIDDSGVIAEQSSEEQDTQSKYSWFREKRDDEADPQYVPTGKESTQKSKQPVTKKQARNKTSSKSSTKKSGNHKTASKSKSKRGIYLDAGYAKGAFFDGFGFGAEFYFLGGQNWFCGIDSDFFLTDITGEWNDATDVKNINFFDLDAVFGLSFCFWKLRPYAALGVGGYVSMIENPKDSEPSGLCAEGNLGLDLLLGNFVIGGAYKLKYFSGSGYIDNYAVSIGYSW